MYNEKTGLKISPTIVGMKQMLLTFKTISDLQTIEVDFFTNINYEVRDIIKAILGIIKKDSKRSEEKKLISSLKNQI